MSKSNLVRYNLSLPIELYRDVALWAKAEHMSLLEVIRKCIWLGLYLLRETKNGNEIIIRSENSSKRLIIL